MATYQGKNARIYLATYAISPMIVSLTPVQEMDIKPYAVMDGVSGYHQLIGLGKDALSLEGLFDDNYTTVLHNAFTLQTSDQVIVLFGASQGERGLAVGGARLKKYTEKAVTTDIIRVAGEFVADNLPWDEVKLLHPWATRTASGNNTAIDDGAASANGSVGYLQIRDLGANDTLQVQIQQSSDNGVGDPFADVMTFATLDGAVATFTTERKTMTGAVERYIRVLWTFGGVGPPYTADFIVVWKRS